MNIDTFLVVIGISVLSATNVESTMSREATTCDGITSLITSAQGIIIVYVLYFHRLMNNLST